MDVIVSGRTYGDAIAGSGVPAEEGWPEPRAVRRGRGVSYVYDGLTPAQRDAILTHLDDVLGTRAGYEGAAAEAAVIRRDLTRNGYWTGGES